MIRKSWIFWYIIKFKDSYFVLLCGKLIKNLLTRMKLTTLQTLWKLDYLRFFWNYLDINYLFQSICNLGVLCGFNTMPCVISQWSPYLVSVVFVTTESNLGQCPFTLDETFFPVVHGGKRFFDCVWVRLLSIGLRVCIPERTISCQLWMGGSPDWSLW